jgi:uncharacterized protein YndB with AHSA1/START domain
MQIRAQAEVFIPRGTEAVFDFATARDTLARFLGPLPPIPGITAVEIEGDGVVRAGARRRAKMTDGTEVMEAILEHERPHRHRYRWLNQRPFPLSLIIRGAEALWAFETIGSGTRFVWTYTFDLTTPLAYPIGRLITLLFGKYMQKGLDRLAELAAAEA